MKNILRALIWNQMPKHLSENSLFLVFSLQLYRLVFSLRHSKEERKDLDWEQEEKGRRARREAAERVRENDNSDAGKKGGQMDR